MVVKRITRLEYVNKTEKYFVIGDNPKMSIDSRDGKFGLIDKSQIQGKVVAKLKR